ncbi:hypothetical protein [Actinocatenispora rupis]|uniref:Antibiotic biosynthesis monooxygenase n=1 Tax=Actinocatenispora rupis TaxID=519421 RepID=A0A8J3NBC0_9ACTN|nr:hypothetical protein [Actinocatenispora rupis]GID12906.1 hypothetical protein Aru02nite_37950 [Actinocatenispora rupis]
MKFVQMIEFTSEHADEMVELDKKWSERAGDDARATHSMLVRDRDRKDHYYAIVEFPSYEDAMVNNDLPATQEFAAEFRKLSSGDPHFVNTDVLDEQTNPHHA